MVDSVVSGCTIEELLPILIEIHMTDPWTLMQRRAERADLQNRINKAKDDPVAAEELRRSLERRSKWRTPQAARLREDIRKASREVVIDQMMAAAKARAKKADVPFDLRSSDIQFPLECPALGITMLSGAYIGTGKASDSSPSLDRIEPQKGYVRGNVQVISNLANTMKNKATPQQLRMFCKWGLKQTAYLEPRAYAEFEKPESVSRELPKSSNSTST